MRRTYEDFDTQLTLRLANRSDITAAMREQLLNDALMHVALMYEHPELEGTSTGTQAIGAESFTVAATDVLWPEYLRNTTNGYAMRLEGKDTIESMTKRSGIPRRYHWWGNTFFTDTLPTVATSYKLFYVKTPSRFDAGETCPIGEQYDMRVLMWAQKFGLESVRDLVEADALGKQIGMFVARMNLPVRKSKMNNYQSRIRVRSPR
jgi:hypothetical protein